MTADPFEEFEFRPLTEGLGFHRQNVKKQAPSAFDLKQALPEIEMPLPGKILPETRSTQQKESSTTVDEILKTLQNRRRPDFDESKAAVAQGPALRASRPAISSVILDGMLVTAATLACLIILLLVTKVDLLGAIAQSEDVSLIFAFFGLFAGVSWIYLVVNRLFMGFTPGEWVFDQRVGLPAIQNSWQYSLRVVVRSTLIIATGFIVLPLISMITGQDVAGSLSGASLLKKV